MRRLLPCLLLCVLGSIPATGLAQSSQFGVRALGIPGREQSARAMGSGGAFALFDGESSLNPASLAYLPGLTAVFTIMGDYRSSTNAAGVGSVRDTRFPQFLVGGPLLHHPLWLSLSYSNYTVRDFSLAFPGTTMLRGVPVGFVDTLESRGGINDLRIGATYRPAQRLALGIGLHVITGTNRVSVKRAFSDTTYQPSLQRAELSFAGFGLSLGAVGQVTRSFALSAFVRADTKADVNVDSTAVSSVDLPVTVGGGIRWRLTPKLEVAGHTIYRNWSTANAGVVALGGIGAVNTFEAAGGLEFTANPRRAGRLPLRLGFRYAKLPFPVTPGQEPKEYGIAAGSGFTFGGDRAGVSLSLERVWRSQQTDFSERAWLVTAGVSVRP